MPNPQPDRQHRTSAGLPPSVEAIRQCDTCILTDRTKRFDVRLPNLGFTRPRLACATGGFLLILRYAATRSVRSLSAPVPVSRIAAIQDSDRGGASGAGEVYSAILLALGWVGVITDGLVGDILGARAWELPLSARSVGVSHSSIHIVDSADLAETLGLRVRSGDLLYAPCYVVFSILAELIAKLRGRAEDFPTPTANRRDRPVTRFLARETPSRHSPNRWRSPC
jgi:regulator of RNase E activity RraA